MCGCGITSDCFGGCPCGCEHRGPATPTYFRDRRGRVVGPNPECIETGSRRVAVVDPRNRDDVKRLTEALYVCGLTLGTATLNEAGSDHSFRAGMYDRVVDALREFTQPAKPEEPTGLGAVVEDAEGMHWVRTDAGEFNKPWYLAPAGIHAHWKTVAAVTVHNPGWSA